MLDGQADSAPGTNEDLAAFLVDNPEADAPEEDELPPDDSVEDSPETNEDSPADDESPEDDSEDAKKQTSGLKFKVPVKGEDGSDTSIEVDEKELIAGYQRHSDYTRKTQELASRSREMETVAQTKVQESQQYFMNQAQLARAAISNLAGLKSPQELYQLSLSDPALAQSEGLRAQNIQGVLQQLDEAMQFQNHQAAERQRQEMSHEIQVAWGILGSKGIDKPKLQAIFDVMKKDYGIEEHRLQNLRDAKLALVMRDAAEYRKLMARKDTVTKQVKDAPRLPQQRQRVPQEEQANKALDRKFRSGKAGLRDLARFV